MFADGSSDQQQHFVIDGTDYRLGMIESERNVRIWVSLDVSICDCT
jgi:hypothetical protein